MDNKLIPAKQVCICEPLTNTTSSGLLMAQGDEKRKPEIGKIIAFGEGDKPVDFKIGDMIVFRRYTDNEIQVLGKVYNFIEFKDIMCVIPKGG